MRVRRHDKDQWSVTLGDSEIVGPGLIGTLLVALLFAVEDWFDRRTA